jgi:hypothetical protein
VRVAHSVVSEPIAFGVAVGVTVISSVGDSFDLAVADPNCLAAHTALAQPEDEPLDGADHV